MESNGEPGAVHISSATAELLRAAGGYAIEDRGPIEVKGRGVMSTAWLRGASEVNPRTGTAALAAAVEEARKRIQAVRKVELFDLMLRRRDSIASSSGGGPLRGGGPGKAYNMKAAGGAGSPLSPGDSGAAGSAMAPTSG